MSINPEIDQERERIIQIFAAEARESLAVMEQAILTLEAREDDAEALGALFREAHTLKGNAAALDFAALAALGHVLEDLLDRRREGLLVLTPERIGLLLESLDGLDEILELSLAENVSTAPPHISRLIERLALSAEGADEADDERGASASRDAILKPKAAAIAASTAPESTRVRRTLRIDVDRLDAMLNLTGEIAVARSRFRRLLAESKTHAALIDTHEQMDRLAADLQGLVLKIRMLPLGPLFQQFRRTARDIARGCDKSVTVDLIGESVEADTSVIENLRDPLTHIIRNAVDHGIETPEERLAAGKPEAGRITLAARHESGGLVVEISDDGRGLDRDLLLNAAVERGLIQKGQRLSPSETDNLIFEAGLSTATTVTQLSGRGVGMDVVRRNVQNLRGSLRVQSERGRGTTLTIRLPLTLAIIPGFEVVVAGDSFVIPMESVVECIVLPEDAEASGVLNLRGEALPYVCLAEHFRLETSQDLARRVIVVVHDANRRAGFSVSSLRGQTQAVIRPLGPCFRGLPGLSGATIGDDGRVGHILDVPVLLRKAEELARNSQISPIPGVPQLPTNCLQGESQC